VTPDAPFETPRADAAAPAAPTIGLSVESAGGGRLEPVSARHPTTTELLLFEYSVADGATNMARDEAMMRLIAPGQVALRFYGWEPWCVSLGRNQPAPERIRGRPRSELTMGTDVVRRPTGGRSVYHGPEVTYAFACADRTAGGPRQVYARLHRGLEAGLAALGVRFDGRSSRSASTPEAPKPVPLDERACFRDPAPSELTVGGRKLVGSAQWRWNRTLLQHGSILLENRQRFADLEVEHDGHRADDAMADDAMVDDAMVIESAIGLADLVRPAPKTPEIVRSLTEAIVHAFGTARPQALAPIAGLAVPRVEIYRSEAWGWRR